MKGAAAPVDASTGINNLARWRSSTMARSAAARSRAASTCRPRDAIARSQRAPADSFPAPSQPQTSRRRSGPPAHAFQKHAPGCATGRPATSEHADEPHRRRSHEQHHHRRHDWQRCVRQQRGKTELDWDFDGRHGTLATRVSPRTGREECRRVGRAPNSARRCRPHPLRPARAFPSWNLATPFRKARRLTTRPARCWPRVMFVFRSATWICTPDKIHLAPLEAAQTRSTWPTDPAPECRRC